MISTDDYLNELISLLGPYGIQVSQEQGMKLLGHLDLVVETNKVMNLTRIVDGHDALIRHVVDSLLLIPCVSKLVTGEASFVDIGTGAGFPGLPLSVVLGHRGLLIDSVSKKVRAVNDFIAALGLDDLIVSEAIRAEDLARRDSRSFDYVTARAVADLGVLVEYAEPLLKKKGSLIVSKAQISDEEILRGDRTAELLGMKRVSRETYELPHNAGHREILAYTKVARSKIQLPRQTGMAKHKPLV